MAVTGQARSRAKIIAVILRSHPTSHHAKAGT